MKTFTSIARHSLQASQVRWNIVQRRGLATTVSTPSGSERIFCIKPESTEKREGSLSQRHMQSALEALHHDGIVMLEDVIPLNLLDSLNERMCKDTKTLIGRGEDGPFNYNLGNLQQSPPYEAKYLSPEIFFNPLATSITTAFLGGKPTMSFISSNAAVKAKEGQPVHCDADFDHPSIPFAAVVNVGLIDMEPKNGSTEQWLGTHSNASINDQQGAHGERASGRIKEDLLEQRRNIRPPIQPYVKKGSLLVRDLRLWHAGMPNTTDEIRIMLAMIHFAPWYRQRMKLDLPKSLKMLFEQQSRLGLSIPAIFEQDHIDHLNAGFGNSFDFDQDK
ncbi:phytanoyl-CoA dioxygenase [Meira miltonrushii]|uniref:Phytanoyl-CoA dioxygenase n=1 Tax=Meira miltonrushii TaxID=1280837 RepID=A0A316V7U4_9BASI|nr:phytanoyl-CoA dioxygenase [Meira miltonrushii]PWN33532.1 phytanoyl-CoA dioxygenase [Meira miltonrushii]